MPIADRFASYASDFEVVYVNDNWELLARYFATNACYITKGFSTTKNCGRDAVLATLKNNVSAFDRKCDSRKLVTTSGPCLNGHQLRRTWRCRFTLDGAPDLTIEGLETVTYLDDLIVQLEEELTPDSQQAMKTWIGAHGKALGIGS